MDLTWKQAGSCRRLDPSLFYPASDDEADPAKAVCRRCPVRVRCLEYAVAHREWDGVWGGTTGGERRVIARRSATGARRPARATAGAGARRRATG